MTAYRELEARFRRLGAVDEAIAMLHSDASAMIAISLSEFSCDAKVYSGASTGIMSLAARYPGAGARRIAAAGRLAGDNASGETSV